AARQALAWSQQADRFENPEVQLELAPSESGATTIQVTLLARAAHLPGPRPIEATGLRASTRLLLLENTPTTWVDASVDTLRVGDDVTVNRIYAGLYGRLQTDELRFDLREITVT